MSKLTLALLLLPLVSSWVVPVSTNKPWNKRGPPTAFLQVPTVASAGSFKSSLAAASADFIPSDLETATPFHPAAGAASASASPYAATPIDCIVEGHVTHAGTKYAIGTPVDHPCALCYFEQDSLVPVDEVLDGELMDRIFPIAKGMVEAEWGSEVSLERTSQTLTIVGDIDDDEEDEDEDEDEGMEGLEVQPDATGDADKGTFVNEDDGEEEVEMLLGFEFEGKEYNLVRMLDPVMLVGAERENGRVELLSDEEGESILGVVEKAFLEGQEGELGEFIEVK